MANNGTLTPPTATEPTLNAAPSDTSANKRKRVDEPDPQSPVDSPQGSSKSAQTQRDILDILKQYDTTPSFLDHAFEETHASISGQPSQKKARLSDDPNKTTISAKLSTAAYPSLKALKDDAARVGEALETSLRAKAKETVSVNAGRLSVDDLKHIQRAKAFEGLISEVVDKESNYEAVHNGGLVKKEVVGLPNGRVAEAMIGANGRMGTVLTLFGNAPTPKQLFSSTQNAPSGKTETAIKSELPIEEMSLPNGLTATKVMPAPADQGKKGPTFEEAFAPPYGLSALHPPKAHKRSSTRDTTITWQFKDSINRSSKKGGYTVQSLTTGDWLGYGGIDSVYDASPREKRKQRDRALSSGVESVKEAPSTATLEEVQAKEEEALFRRAYGSFAPCADNAKSVLPAETKSMVWWHKVGEKRFTDTFAIDPALLDESHMGAVNVLSASKVPVKEDDFESVVRELDDVDEEMANAESGLSKSDVEQVLHDVSQLLETLASHQRIRNATLASTTAASRAPISPAPILASRIGKPDEPAEDEISTYNALRRELAYLILKLPPYAVAKIDGDQLAELGVSTLIPIESKDIKGTMEEDQVARLAKYNAMATAAGIASLTRGSSSSGQHYNTTAQRTPAIGQAANTRYGQTPQYSTAKTPAAAPQYQRSTSSQSTYGTPSATAARPAYAQPTSQYTRPGAPQQTYTQSNGYPQTYQQRPAQATPGGYGSYGQQYSQQTPAHAQSQPQRPTYSTSQPLAQYQQRSHAAAQNAVGYQTNAATAGVNRTMSPFTHNNNSVPAAKPPGVYGQQQPQAPQQPANVQPRPAYSSQGQYAAAAPQLPGSGRATPTVYPSQPQTPVNGYPAQRPPPPAPAVGLARVGSGTPQPAQQLAQQVQAQVQANGHV